MYSSKSNIINRMIVISLIFFTASCKTTQDLSTKITANGLEFYYSGREGVIEELLLCNYPSAYQLSAAYYKRLLISVKKVQLFEPLSDPIWEVNTMDYFIPEHFGDDPIKFITLLGELEGQFKKPINVENINLLIKKYESGLYNKVTELVRKNNNKYSTRCYEKINDTTIRSLYEKLIKEYE
ncbi:hypothetical protein N8199_04470 [Emcibacteraceae bacterium]|jgi:hypothetical protein|nr:hypothetical protein [Emcibacteraceae bacterium]